MTLKSGSYTPGTIVFMGPNGTFGGGARCVEFKWVAPPNREPHVVVRFDAPFLEQARDGSQRPIPPDTDHLTIHAGLRVHLTGGQRSSARRVLHADSSNGRVHHLFAAGLPLPTCPIGQQDGQRIFQGAAFIPYGDASVPGRVVIDVWGANSHAELLAWRSTTPAHAPLSGARPASSAHGETTHVFGQDVPRAMWLEFTAWELPILADEDPQPVIIWVSCPHH